MKALVVNYPTTIEVFYKRLLLRLVKVLQTNIKQKVILRLSSLLVNYNVTKRKDDDFSSIIDDILNEIEESGKIQITFILQQLPRIAKEIRKFVSRQVAKSVITPAFSIKIPETLGVNIFTAGYNKQTNDMLHSWVLANTRLIKTIPTNFLNDVAGVIETGFRSGLSYETITKDLQAKFDISENRAKLIARDQVAKLNSNLLRKEYLDLGLVEYEWSTSKDERVRTSHKAMQGKICSFNDPTTYKENNIWKKRSGINGVEKHTGEDYQCRCLPRAILK